MTDWKNHLELGGLFTEDADPAEVARETQKRMRELESRLRFGPVIGNTQKDELRGQFQDLIQDLEGLDNEDDFNDVLERLYNLGDTPLDERALGRKFIWIETSMCMEKA